MEGNYYRRQDCRLCGSKNVFAGIKFEATPPGDIFVKNEELGRIQECYPLDLCLCRDCGSIQLLDVVNPKLLYGTYLYQTSISLGLPEHFRAYARDCLSVLGLERDKLVIDIGSNDGTLLRCFQEEGMKVLGIDPAPEAVGAARLKGVDTIQNFFDCALAEKIRIQRGDISLVTANNVIANIDELGDFVDGVKVLIEPQGYFVLETGCGRSLFENRLIDVVYHEHLSYFTVKPLDNFFRRHGMKIVDAYWIPSKGGSIRCFVQSMKSLVAVLPTVAQMILLEESKGIGTLEPFSRMSAFIKQRKEELGALLDNLRGRGKTIAGYGASVGVTTLLHLFGLNNRLDFLVDDNPVRFGRFSPGHHIPVYSSETLNEKKPDYVLILSWRYTQPIIKRHEEYVRRGGRFISCLQDLKIL